MNEPRGGRITLRRTGANVPAVEYEGEMAFAGRAWPCRFRIDSDGKVEPAIDSSEGCPEWLADFAAATLRAAFRASHATGRWPRRISRWRPEPERRGQS